MKKQKILMLILSALFALLMSLPWLVPHLGVLALVGFVPLLCLDRVATQAGVRRFWLWHYGSFVLWNALTTFWVCEATVGGGIFAVLANALQMSLIFGLFRFSKKRLGGALPYIFLAVMWIAWERFYFSAEISWPWLVLGNAFASSTHLVQWYEYTGSLGGSLWIWACNLAVFGLMTSLSDGSWGRFNSKARIAALAGTVIVFFVPMIVSGVIYERYEEVSEGQLDVLIGQPNFDPYHKFELMSQDQQTAVLLDLFESAMEPRDSSSAPLMLLTPETFTGDIILNDVSGSVTWRRFVNFLSAHPGTSMLFGASSYEFIDPNRIHSPSARQLNDGRWVESHNSAISLEADGRTEVYHKSRLVVGTELMPYPKVFGPLTEWLGVSIGRCVGQPYVSVLHPAGVPVGCAVCYESVYGEYCTGYVQKGARAMTVITNDAWWGNTPGYRQHFSYSRLRAIELRRDFARCGNTGISAFIDQRGDVVQRGPWWEEATLRGTLNLNSSQTFFVQHGDMTGRVCTFMFLMLLLVLVVRCFTRKF